MTVAELFEHFLFNFNKIIYFDETNNIEDYIESDFNNFKDQYNSFNVIEWSFDNDNNNIILDIKKGSGNNDDKTTD